jgi:hypothetical protein
MGIKRIPLLFLLTAFFTLTGAVSANAQTEPPIFLMIDEDTIDNGIKTIERISFKSPFCGDHDPAVCVNDDIADPGNRELLFTRGMDITPFSGLVLPTGQIGDEGLFMFANPDSQISLQNGATFSTGEFILATGLAADENNLDKIDGVVPLNSTDIYNLLGRTVCAVVYDSDISVDVAAGFGNLKGATLGLTGFTVTAVSPHPKGGSYLPLITVNLLSSLEVQATCSNLTGSSLDSDGDGIPDDQDICPTNAHPTCDEN